jgi:alkaline phosphatase D
VEQGLADNPHIRFFDGARHGYLLCELGRGDATVDFRVVPSVEDADATAYTLATFGVENGARPPHRIA